MTLNSRTGLICVAILALLCGACGFHSHVMAEEAATYRLKFQFAPGQDWYYVCPNGASYLVEYSQAKETVTHTSMFLRHLSVVKVNEDGSADIQLVLDRAYMTAQNGGVNSLYNSDVPDQVPTEFAGVHASIGKPQNFRLSPFGKILPIPGQPQSVEQVELLFQLPEQPIAIGATWKERFEASVPVNKDSKLSRPLKMERHFKLTSVDEGIASIAMTTVCLSPMNDPFQESQIMQRKANGVIRFDIEKGYLVDRRLQIQEKVVGHEGPGSA